MTHTGDRVSNAPSATPTEPSAPGTANKMRPSRRALRETTGTVLARIPARMIDLAVAYGLDRKELVDAAGLGGIDLTDGDARVPIATQVALWQLIAKRLPTSNVGLRAGASFKVREAGLLGYVVAHSATLETALERLVRYSWVLNDAVKCEMVKNRRSLAVTQSYPEHGAGLQDAVDYRLAALVSVCRQITGAEIVPVEVAFVYQQRRNTLEHRRFFLCPLRFGASISSVVFSAHDLRLQVRHADETLAEYLREHAERMLRSLMTGSSARERVRSAIWNVLSDGRPTLKRIASALQVPSRTLQRRLTDEGTSVEQEIEAIRKSMAMAMLRDPANATDEVAFLLGYREHSTLFRSFRRWTGMTPQEYRSSQLA